MQMQFQPEVQPLLCLLPLTNTDSDVIHDTLLYLPSSLPPDILAGCSRRLVLMETELRTGQCRDCLTQLRTRLNTQAHLLKHKYVNVRHQAPNTRSKELLNRTTTRINAITVKYHSALKSLQALDKDEEAGWRSEFLELGGDDLRSLSEPKLPSAPTRDRALEIQARSLLNGGALPEGTRTISWIWRGAIKGGLVDNEGNGDQSDYGEGSEITFPTVRLLITVCCQNFALSGQRLARGLQGGRKK